MRQARRQQWIALAAGILVTVCGMNALHAAEDFWKQLGLNEARKLEKPILLYVYAVKAGKPCTSAARVQRIFSNPAVKQAFAGFTNVTQPVQCTSWPVEYTLKAKNSVALFVMTCDAHPIAVFTQDDLPKRAKDPKAGGEDFPELRGAADVALKGNPRALAALKRNPPKDYVSPQQLAAQREAAAQPPEPKPEEKANTAAILLEEKPKQGATAKPENASAPKSTKPPEESE